MTESYKSSKIGEHIVVQGFYTPPAIPTPNVQENMSSTAVGKVEAVADKKLPESAFWIENSENAYSFHRSFRPDSVQPLASPSPLSAKAGAVDHLKEANGVRSPTEKLHKVVKDLIAYVQLKKTLPLSPERVSIFKE